MGKSVARVCAVLTAVLATVAGLLAFAPSASAALFESLTRSDWSYVDSRKPAKTLGGDDDGMIPVGSWLDEAGVKHTAKGYVTFDLRNFAGRTVQDASVLVTGEQADDCTKARATELWTVDSAGGQTWRNQPAELTRLFTPDTADDCPAYNLRWAATEAVQAAIDNGEDSLRLALRISAEHQRDVAYGRRYDNNVSLGIESTGPLGVPKNLAAGGTACSDDVVWNSDRAPRLTAYSRPADSGTRMVAEYELWKSSAPAEVTRHATTESINPSVGWSLAGGVIEEGVEYTWRVRMKSGGTTTEWSPQCRFDNDFTRPQPPLVSSQDYPDDGAIHDGSGLPGDFTLDPNGSDDVVGYYYGSQGGGQYVAAEPGEPVTITYTPEGGLRVNLPVYSVDRAGNRSDTTNYTFLVVDTAPGVDGPWQAYVGQRPKFTLTPNLPDVESYTYQLADGPERTVEADADGNAVVRVRLNNRWDNTVKVRSVSADGRRSGLRSASFTVLDQPQITSAEYPEHELSGGPGVEGTFRLKSWTPTTTKFGYCFSETETCGEVAADGKGRADLTYTPAAEGYYLLEAWALRSDGTQSETTTYFIYVQG